MFNLVLKDILIQKKSLIFFFLYILFFSFMFKGTPSVLFTTAPIMISYILLIGACSLDDKNRSEIMLNSLPINRITLVTSKYVSTCAFVFIGIFLAFILSTILNSFGIIHFSRLISLTDILGDVVAVSLFSSLYLPIYFKFGYQKTRYLNAVIIFLFCASTAIISKLMVKGGAIQNFIFYLNSQPNWVIGSLIIIINCIIFLISLLFSIKFYVNKDL